MTQDTEAYRRLFESHPVAMAIWDPATGMILAVNDAAIRQYGYDLEEARRLTVDRLVHPDDWPRLRERLATMPPGHVSGETFRHLRRDGSVIEVEMTGHELLLDGKPTRVVMALDVTDRRRLEERLRHSAVRLGEIDDVGAARKPLRPHGVIPEGVSARGRELRLCRTDLDARA